MVTISTPILPLNGSPPNPKRKCRKLRRHPHHPQGFGKWADEVWVWFGEAVQSFRVWFRECLLYACILNPKPWLPAVCCMRSCSSGTVLVTASLALRHPLQVLINALGALTSLLLAAGARSCAVSSCMTLLARRLRRVRVLSLLPAIARSPGGHRCKRRCGGSVTQ